MSVIQVPNSTQVDAKSQAIFAQLEKKLGMVPNLYATIGHSSNALEAFLSYSATAGKGSFSNKEKETINLAVSEINNCQYCLAAHTAIAKSNGLSQNDTLDIRSGSHENPRLAILSILSQDLVKNRGKADRELINRFFSQGFTNSDLIELISVVTAITFTNYVHGATQVPIDFPKAEALQEVVAQS